MQREVVQERARRNEDGILSSQRRLEGYRETYLPRAERLAEYTEQHYPSLYRDDPEKGTVPLESCTVQLPGGETLEGEFDDVLKELNQFVKACQEIEIPRQKVKERIGTLKVQQLDIQLYARPRYLDGTGGVVLEAEVKNPLSDGIVGEYKVASAKGVINIYEANREYLMKRPSQLQSMIKEEEAVIGKLVSEQRKMESYDETRLHTLEKELADLEEDMRTNPMQRRGRRGQAQAPAQQPDEPVEAEVEVIEEAAVV
jgi:polyhydroxyalkanoate synthesis regulator phasin